MEELTKTEKNVARFIADVWKEIRPKDVFKSQI